MASQFVDLPLEGGSGSAGITSINGDTSAAQIIAAGSGISVASAGGTTTITNTGGGGGSGTVTSVSVVSANGLAGTVATATTTPAITLRTSITGILQGNGTAISAATIGNFTDVGTDGIVVTGGTNAVLGSGTSIAQHVADSTHNGYLLSSDWVTFNSKQPALTIGNLTDVGTDGIVVTGGTGAVIGSGTSIAQHVADSTHNGYLSSTDWVTFNAKQSALTIGNLTDVGTDGITITGGTGSVIGSGTSISQHVADSTHNGYLSSADWVTFNAKQSTALTAAHIFVGNGSNIATDVAMSGDISINNTGVTAYAGTVPINKGGTGQVTANAALNALLPNQATHSGEFLTTNGTNTSWSAVSGSGTVTSVAMTVPSFLSVAGSPITTSGTLALTLANESANTIFAGPSTGSPAAPTFRSLVAADIPALPYASSTLTSAHIFVGNVSNVATDVAMSGDISINNAGATAYAGTVPINKGGSGQTTANAALNAFLPTQSGHSGEFLTTNGTNSSWASAGGGGSIPSVYKSLVLSDVPNGYWRLGETSGTTMADSSTSAQNGTYVNSPTLGVSGAIASDYNTGVKFDGFTSQVGSVPDNSIYDFDSVPFSGECWIRFTLPTHDDGVLLIDKIHAGGQGWAFMVGSFNGVFTGIGNSFIGLFLGDTLGDYTFVNGSTNVRDGNWHHVAFTSDGSSLAAGINLYVDGIAETINVYNAGSPSGYTNTDPLLIGGPVFASATTFCELDEAAVYASELDGVIAFAERVAAAGVHQGIPGRVAYSNGPQNAAGAPNLYYDYEDGRLGIGISNPKYPLAIEPEGSGGGFAFGFAISDNAQLFAASGTPVNNVILGNYDKNTGTADAALFIGTNDAPASNPLGLKISTTGNATAGSRSVTLESLEIGLTQRAMQINPGGGDVLIGGGGSIITIPSASTGTIILNTLTYPAADGTAGQFLMTNGSAALSFSGVAAGSSGEIQYNSGSGNTLASSSSFAIAAGVLGVNLGVTTNQVATDNVWVSSGAGALTNPSGKADTYVLSVVSGVPTWTSPTIIPSGTGSPNQIAYWSDGTHLEASATWIIRATSDGFLLPSATNAYDIGEAGTYVRASYVKEYHISGAANSRALTTDSSGIITESTVTDASLKYLFNADPLTQVSIIDNSTANIFTYAFATYGNFIIDYSLYVNSGIAQSGTIKILAIDGVSSISNTFISVGAPIAISFAAPISGGDVSLEYTVSGMGINANFLYEVRKWQII